MTRTLFVAARSAGSDAGVWATVGKLTRDGDLYEFRYTKGAEKLAGVAPFPGMPDLSTVYRSKDLLPIFKNRLLSQRRPEYRAWLSWGGFDPDSIPDAMTMLSTLGSRRAADSLELYTGPVRQPDGTAYSQFFLHGVRHCQHPDVLAGLKAGLKLSLRPESDNPVDRYAVAVEDTAQTQLGYVPRFLTIDIRFLIENCPNELIVRIKEANYDAPMQYQILCELEACWPKGFAPCSGPDFEPVSALPDAGSVDNQKKAI
jgi:hypothetical protein